MPDAASVLLERLQAAFDTIAPGADPVLRPSDRADFQANGALPLAKVVGRPPRQVAEEVVAAASLDDICAEVEVSGPGFINLTLSDELRGRPAAALSADERLGVGLVARPETVVIDYSSPNVAKEMHVGHLRSTLIGDALARVLGVPRSRRAAQNHIGDWGTPFGMLIEHLLDVDGAADAESFSVRDLNASTRGAQEVRRRPRLRRALPHRVVLLQAGDDETLHLWRIFVAESMRHFGEVYEARRPPTPEDIVGESFYNPLLPAVSPSSTRRACGGERRRAVRVPPGLRPPTARPSPHRAQARRRLRLRDDRPGGRARPHRPSRRHPAALRGRRPSRPSTSPGLRAARLAGCLPAGRGGARRVRLRPRTDGKKLASRAGESDASSTC